MKKYQRNVLLNFYVSVYFSSVLAYHWFCMMSKKIEGLSNSNVAQIQE